MLNRRLLIRAVLFAVPLAAAGAAVSVVNAMPGGKPRVDICHNGHTITVAAPAIPAHLAHGDTLGACASATSMATATATEPPADTPTATSTGEPTATSTDVPTDEPTATPTDVPTDEPTATPTEPPGETPTDEPTATPTEPPAETPTDTPESMPTDTPELTPTETPTETPVGGASIASAVDAALALQYASGLLTHSQALDHLDVNHDGHIDAIDAALVLQRIAGLI